MAEIPDQQHTTTKKQREDLAGEAEQQRTKKKTIDGKDEELLALIPKGETYGQKSKGPSETHQQEAQKKGIRDNKRSKRHEKEEVAGITSIANIKTRKKKTSYHAYEKRGWRHRSNEERYC